MERGEEGHRKDERRQGKERGHRKEEEEESARKYVREDTEKRKKETEQGRR
jgi:hypothetical protein